MKLKSLDRKSIKNIVFSTAAGLVSATLVSGGFAGSAEALVKAKSHNYRRARYGHLAVPPPPVYMPSLAGDPRGYAAQAAETKPTNPSSKYVRCSEGWEAPVPVQPNKYVSYYNRP